MYPLLILLGVFASVILVLLAVAKPKQKEDVEARLKKLNDDEDGPRKAPTDELVDEDAPPAKKDAVADLNNQLDELFRPIAKKRLKDSDAEALAKVIANAGRYTMTPVQLRTWQYKAAFLAPVGAGIFLNAILGFQIPTTPLLIAAAAAVGYYYPVFALNQESTKRRATILRQLPTTLDLLTICVEAGLSLQASMVKVVEKTKSSPLRDEIDQALREIQLGRPRGQALKDMAKRINLKEVNSVVLSMVQAEAMGTSIAKSLRVQSAIARENRWTRAQEQAFKAPVKLSFPLIFFIFPVIFVVIFGPLVLDVMSNWVAE